MAEVLFITENDLKRFTIVNGNVDPDKFMHYIKTAQDIHLDNYLGVNLSTVLKEKIKENKLSEENNKPYKNLLSKFIRPTLVNWAMVEYLPFSAFNLTNKGLYKSYAEDSESIESKELAYLVNKQRLVAQSYTDKMIEHINQNAEEYPEYFTHSESGNPDKTSSYFTGWQL